MAIQDDNTILKKADLKAYHEKIAPMLGGTFMVGTNNSDYYSTDEKVIGVYNGKPLYQKTWTGLNVSTTASSAVSLGISVNNLDKYVGYEASGYHSTAASKRVLTSYIGHLFTENATSTTSNFSYYCLYSGIIITDVTLRYTKTTDAAGSALTTPGAYDINFPNTWPANKEIYFGNGIYGQRRTGTITSTANARDVAQLFEIPANLINPFVSQGGSWVRDNSNVAISFGASDSNGYSSNINYNGANGHVALISTSVNARTNAPYDIWITYTK